MDPGAKKSIEKKRRKRKPKDIVLPSVSDGLLAHVANQIVRIKDRRERNRYVRDTLLPSNTHILSTAIDTESTHKIQKARRRKKINSYDGWASSELAYLVEVCAHDRIQIKTPSSIYMRIANTLPQDAMAPQNVLQMCVLFMECGTVDGHAVNTELFLDRCIARIADMPNRMLRKTFPMIPVVFAVLHSAYEHFTHDVIMRTMRTAVGMVTINKPRIDSGDVDTIHINMNAIYYRMLTMADQEHLRTWDIVAENPDQALCIQIEAVARDLDMRIVRITHARIKTWMQQGTFKYNSLLEPDDIAYAVFKKTHNADLPLGYIVLDGQLNSLRIEAEILSFERGTLFSVEDYDPRRESTTLDRIRALHLDKPVVRIKSMQTLLPARGTSRVLLLYAMAKITEARCADALVLETDADTALPSASFYIGLIGSFSVAAELHLGLDARQRYMAITDLHAKMHNKDYITDALSALADQTTKTIRGPELYFNRFNYGQKDLYIHECHENIKTIIELSAHPPKKEHQLADLVGTLRLAEDEP
jgi:hypothetical protein